MSNPVDRGGSGAVSWNEFSLRGPEHFQEAERLLGAMSADPASADKWAEIVVARAQAHATLAQVAMSAFTAIANNRPRDENDVNQYQEMLEDWCEAVLPRSRTYITSEYGKGGRLHLWVDSINPCRCRDADWPGGSWFWCWLD